MKLSMNRSPKGQKEEKKYILFDYFSYGNDEQIEVLNEEIDHLRFILVINTINY